MGRRMQILEVVCLEFIFFSHWHMKLQLAMLSLNFLFIFKHLWLNTEIINLKNLEFCCFSICTLKVLNFQVHMYTNTHHILSLCTPEILPVIKIIVLLFAGVHIAIVGGRGFNTLKRAHQNHLKEDTACEYCFSYSQVEKILWEVY